jgi:hypothetical protein
MTTVSIKLMFFGTGAVLFVILVVTVNNNVYEHSGGTESLVKFYQHGSPYKALCVKVIATWVLFPIWWVLSADGLKVVAEPEVNTLITSFLNIFAKGLYVVFVERMRNRYLSEDSLMAHPKPRAHEIQHALNMAARLGPTGAIQSIVKNIETQEKQMNYIRSIMASDSAKYAAQILTDPDNASCPLSPRNQRPPTSPTLVGTGLTAKSSVNPSSDPLWNGTVAPTHQGVGALNAMTVGGASKQPQREQWSTENSSERIENEGALLAA